MSSTSGPRLDTPPSEGTDVSVLTPVLNEAAHLDAAIADMVAQRFDGTIEFIFIDGGSEDESRSILQRWAERDPRVRVLDNPARRTPHALNIGLRAARGEFVSRMDAHTHYPPNYIADGVRRLRAGGAVYVFGPQIAVGRGRWSRRVALGLMTPLGIGGASWRRMPEEEFEADSGFTGMWRRDLLEAQGGWNEEWVNDQDYELTARLIRAGGRLVCVPSMAARYIPRDSLTALARQYWRYGRFRVKTSLHYPESMRPSHLVAPTLVLTIVAAGPAPRPVASLARAGVAAYAVALGVTTVRVARQSGPREALGVPVVLVTMHLAWGIGFLRGCREFGFPGDAIRGAARNGARAPFTRLLRRPA